MKKLSIIGKGTAGAFSVAAFLKYSNWEIDWYFDPNIKPQAVGEGSDVTFPTELHDILSFQPTDLYKIDGSYKEGINKVGWGNGKTFMHSFSPPFISYHFNANMLQEYIFDRVKNNPRLNVIKKNVSHDDIDSDFIFDCSGRPKDFNQFHISEYIPVNAVHVTQCYWDHIKFQHTLAIARPYGWVFGIPLQNRCSIGYMYNHDINNLKEVKEDVKQIFSDYNLTPSTTTNSFTFPNYYRKENYSSRIAYSGNASFFLEPLEATSITLMNFIQKHALRVWHGVTSVEEANNDYLKWIREIEDTIMLHYCAGSIYDTKFWEYAQDRGNKCMTKALKTDLFKDCCEYAKQHKASEINSTLDWMTPYGTWRKASFIQNLEGLDLYSKIDKLAG